VFANYLKKYSPQLYQLASSHQAVLSYETLPTAMVKIFNGVQPHTRLIFSSMTKKLNKNKYSTHKPIVIDRNPHTLHIIRRLPLVATIAVGRRLCLDCLNA
jgi:hypothetical protein